MTGSKVREDRRGVGRRGGLLAMCAAMLLLPVGDAISKLLTDLASPFDVTVWRTLAQGVFCVPVALLMRKGIAGEMVSGAAVLSGLLTLIVLVCLITAFETMPIATAIAIFFIEPLLLTVLARPFLGERVGPGHYAAVAIGLVGAVIVIRPKFDVFGPVVLLPAVAALAFALNMILVRKATRRRSALAFQLGATFSAAALSAVAYVAVVPFREAVPSILEVPSWGLVAVLAGGAIAAVSFILIAFAFRHAEATLLAPMQYLEIVGATAVGFAVFGDFPDSVTWLGILIILGSGLYIVRREQRRP